MGALAAVVVVLELIGAWVSGRRFGEPDLTALGAALLALRGGALVFGRTHPYAVGLVVAAASTAYGVAELPDPVLQLAPLVALCLVLLAASRRAAALITLLAIFGTVAATVAPGDSDAADYYLAVLVPALAWAVAEMERNRRAHASEAAARGAAEERARIARELHDVVAHHVGMMVVQAEAGASVAPAGDDRVADAFDGIAAAGRSALGELRRLLAGWRGQHADAEPPEPQPGLDRLDALIGVVREAGLPVDLHVEGQRRVVPPGVDLSAYRIVQEALTNVLKHAGPARASVTVRYDDVAVDVVVRDDGRGGAANGDGHGLTGIRERVALFGGDVRIGPVAGGGYEVAARLPFAP